ncbi:GPW/gp25 family protein [Candidatus Dojkabacteria bacterium]|jgi:phage baseplate assembly protein W|nr:GPW/gp25 family protein [Candidatus Dojkabacteria bacterium]
MSTINTDTGKERIFKDLDLNFNIHPVKKDINMHLKEMAVISALKNLILTNFYERPFRPYVGSNIRRLLFENIDVIIASQLEREIAETITNFEPRVSIKRVSASPSPDQNKYNMEIEFYIVNNPNPVTIRFFLERIR